MAKMARHECKGLLMEVRVFEGGVHLIAKSVPERLFGVP